MSDVKIRKETKRFAYSQFWFSFEWLINIADKKELGWPHLKLSALILGAFSVEAYSNHVGETLFPNWKKMGKGKSLREKIIILMDKVGVQLKVDEKPFLTVCQLITWRNSVAHGHSFKSKANPLSVSHEEYQKMFRKMESESAEWERFLNDADLGEIKKDLEEVMRKIFNASGLKGEYGNGETLFELPSLTRHVEFKSTIRINLSAT